MDIRFIFREVENGTLESCNYDTYIPVSIKVVDQFSDWKSARHLATLQLVEVRVQQLVARLRPSRYVDNEVTTFVTQLTRTDGGDIRRVY